MYLDNNSGIPQDGGHESDQVPPLVRRENDTDSSDSDSDASDPFRPRRRHSNQPVDKSLNISSPVFRGRYTEIGLNLLSQSDVLATKDIRRRYIDTQILRIITPRQNRFAQVMYRMRRGQGNRNENQTYNRIYLCRVFSDVDTRENSRLFYILQSGNENHDIWNRNPEHRDNGTIRVGSFIRVVNPEPINRFMQGIPMITTDTRVYALDIHPSMNSIPINNNIDGNQALAFCYNARIIRINHLSILHTGCTGLHCDKQDVAVNPRNSPCGCFGNSPFRSNLAYCFSVSFNSDEGEVRVMPNFSSLAFQKLFFSRPLPAELAASSLSGTEVGLDAEDAIIDCVDYVNLWGGWTVVGWYKRGLINDVSLAGAVDGEENRVHAENVSLHIVQLIPTNRHFLDPESIRYDYLKNRQFDVNNFLNAAAV